MAPRVVLPDRLDGLCKAVFAGKYEVEDGPADNFVWDGPYDVSPRGADLADLACEVQVHNDVEAVLSGLL